MNKLYQMEYSGTKRNMILIKKLREIKKWFKLKKLTKRSNT